MSDLCGAWLLSGRSAERTLAPAGREALLRSLPSWPAGVEQLCDGPLWLAAARGKAARGAGGCVAYEGALAPEAGGVAALLDRLAAGAEGAGDDGASVWACARIEPAALVLHRDHTGCESLYFASREGLLLFASSLRVLLAWPGLRRDLDGEAVEAALVEPHARLGWGALVAGVQALSPGGTLSVSGGRFERRDRAHPTFQPGPERWPSAAEARAALLEATALAAGGEKRVAVSLSGGLDSALVAWCAAEALGACNVTAFTRVFDDPSRASEAPFAALVCGRLGIEHRVVRITAEEHLRDAAETLRKGEFPLPPRTPVLAMARAAAREGFSRLLSGRGLENLFGLHANVAYLEAVLRLAARRPRALSAWRLGALAQAPWRALLKRLHPGLVRPPGGLLFPILCALRHAGLIEDPAAFYPGELRPLVEALTASPNLRAALAQPALGPAETLQYAVLRCLPQEAMAAHQSKAFRESGVALVCPAVLRPCATLLRGAARRAGRDPAAGPALRRELAAGLLPRETLGRRKVPQQGVSPEAWDERLLAPFSAELPSFISRIRPLVHGDPARLSGRWRLNLARLAFWEKTFLQ